MPVKLSGFPNSSGISNEVEIANKLTVDWGTKRKPRLSFAADERLNYVIPFSSSEQERHQRVGKCSLIRNTSTH